MLEITGVALGAACGAALAQMGGGRDFWGRDGTEEMKLGQSLSTLALKELKVSMKWEVGSLWGEQP